MLRRDFQGCQLISHENTNSQETFLSKEKKKWRQACVSNPNVLLFIQTRGNHWLVQNAPKPFA